MEVRDNAAKSRFEADTDAGVAVADYRVADGVMTLTHTHVPESARGAGVGEALARHALDEARARGLRVKPQCPFIAEYIEEHPEYEDLVVA